MCYLLRSDTVLARAATTLKAEHFARNPFEAVCGVLWTCVSGYYAAHRCLPTETILSTLLEAELQQVRFPLTQDQLVEAFRRVAIAHSPQWDDSRQHVDYGLKLLNQFLTERTVMEHARQAVLRPGDQQPAAELVNELTSRLNISNSVLTRPGVNPFATMNEGEIQPRVPTGARWFDLLVGGGLWPRGGDVVGFVGGSSWGKTIAGVHLSVAVAQRGSNVGYFCYEQPVEGPAGHEMTHRFIACAADIDSENLMRGLSQLEPAELESFHFQRAQLATRLHVFDLSSSSGRGCGGASELDSYLSEMARHGHHPHLVVIDWFGTMLNRYLSTRSGYRATGNEVHAATIIEVDKLSALATRYSTNIFVVNQNTAEARDRPSHAAGRQGDVAGGKNFSDLMQFCITMSAPDDQGRCMFTASKARSKSAMQVTVQRNGPRQRWEMVDMVMDHRDHRWRSRDEASGGVIDIPIGEVSSF